MDGPRNMNMTYSEDNKINMTIPERIVLSAGYDGDDNEEHLGRSFRNIASFDDPPIVNPDEVMAGMHTPPSVLTIDHSSNTYKRESPNWHEEGDGADENDSESSLYKTNAQHKPQKDDDDFPNAISPQRSIVIAGREDSYSHVIPYNDPLAMQRYYTSLQRRLTIVENELEYQNRVANSGKVEARRKIKKQTGVYPGSNNPFETHANRLKYDVIGKKSHATKKDLPGVSRSRANEKRKRTLLKSYKERNKTHSIIDQRFGEYDDVMSIEDKMLKRFTLEKQRHHQKPSMFNLNDEEDLTHYGQRLADIGSFDDAGLKLFDEDRVEPLLVGGILSRKVTGGDDNKNKDLTQKNLTRQQIIDEVVANSKKQKFDRQQMQERTFELTQQIDSQLNDIRSLFVKRNSEPAKSANNSDDYDRTVNELLFEGKAKATDRVKSEEELVREEKEHLQRLERERLKRMNEEREDETFASADAIVESVKKVDKRHEVRYCNGRMILPKEAGSSLLTIEEDSDESEGSEEDDSESEGNIDLQKEPSEEVNSSELPFTYKAPSSLKQFLQFTEKFVNNKDVMTVIERVRKCNHVKLDANNQGKMQRFFVVILEYVDYLCDAKEPRLDLIHEMSKIIRRLYDDVPLSAAKSIQKKLEDVFQAILSRGKGKSQSMFPNLKELIFLKIISFIFPTSDLNHVITTPAIILITMVMSQGHFVCLKDVISGVFLLDILCDCIKLSKRYVPESICFIGKLFYQASSSPVTNMSPNILNVRKDERNFLVVDEKMKRVPALNVSECLSAHNQPSDNYTRAACLRNALLLTTKLCNMYSHLETFHESFEPCAILLERVSMECYPKTLKKLYRETLQLMRSKASVQRVALTLQDRKPVPLPLFEPRFDEKYEPRSKRRLGDKTQNEVQKLKYKIKKETKGAMRELRKDAHFLAKERLKETMSRDMTRRKKVIALENDLANERRDVKAMKRKKT